MLEVTKKHLSGDTVIGETFRLKRENGDPKQAAAELHLHNG
ncbi:MAG: hypothetical protein P8J79_01280 [Halioglobus sp.]|nr:hypothetical protein [Halioglobus sp.]